MWIELWYKIIILFSMTQWIEKREIVMSCHFLHDGSLPIILMFSPKNTKKYMNPMIWHQKSCSSWDNYDWSHPHCEWTWFNICFLWLGYWLGCTTCWSPIFFSILFRKKWILNLVFIVHRFFLIYWGIGFVIFVTFLSQIS